MLVKQKHFVLHLILTPLVLKFEYSVIFYITESLVNVFVVADL